MKRIIAAFLLIMAISAQGFPQQRDSLLREINNIKKAQDKYLYGLCTLPGEDNPALSVQEAAKQLSGQVEAFIAEGDFVFLKDKKEIPEELKYSITCLVRPSCYRTIVYVEKESIVSYEKALADELGNAERKKEIGEFVQQLKRQSRIGDVLDLIAASPLSAHISAGQKIDDSTQSKANDGIFVYFDPKTRNIQEIMSPMEKNGGRKNLLTGEVAIPLRYRNAPLWIYIEGLKTVKLF